MGSTKTVDRWECVREKTDQQRTRTMVRRSRMITAYGQMMVTDFESRPSALQDEPIEHP
jgi:hypothetical protein